MADIAAKLSNWFGGRSLSMSSRDLHDWRGDTDEAIVAAILRSSDPTLFSVIVARYRARLNALAKSTLLGSPAASEAEDIVQDSFIAAYDNLKSFRTQAAFRPWLYRIVLNRCVDRIRRRKFEADEASIDEAIDSSPGPLDTIVNRERAEAISRAVERLPIEMRTIFLLRHMDDLTYAELSVITGLPEGTVKSHLHRARARVREMVGGPES